MSERAALHAVLLDAGGTLVRLDFEWMAETLGALGCPVRPADLRRAEIEGRRRYDQSRGQPLAAGARHPALGSHGEIHAYFDGMLAAAGVPAAARGEAVARFLARQAEPIGLWARPVEGAREALRALGALGLRRAVISNSDGRAEAHLVHGGVRDGVEFVVDSQRVGIEKPDPAIFHLALERLGVPAARAIYVGDIRSVDEAGARAAGLHFVLLDPYGDYAGPETPAVRALEDLPGWLEERFRVPAHAARRPVPGGD